MQNFVIATLYTYDALNRLISVSSPTGLTTYQYDAFHRRIAKTHQGQTKRYIYQGQNEIGCLSDQGEVTQLRILGIGIDAEMGAAVALELHGKMYTPIHNAQGSVASLIDEAGSVAEIYRYSAFGEESILNAQGQKVERSQVGNPWRFASKRTDSETGWIYFGRRYYDPEIGRWTTPDPLGWMDGPNLYAYLHHNPLNAYDAYGLIGEAYIDSCEAGMNTNRYSVFSDLGSSEIQSNEQDRASYISGLNHAMAGIFHGGMNFFTNQLCDLASIACMIGVHECADSLEERLGFQAAYYQCQIEHMQAFDGLLANCLCADPNHPIYQTCRSYTTVGLEIGSLAIGSYGLAKGGVALAKMGWRSFSAGAKLLVKLLRKK